MIDKAEPEASCCPRPRRTVDKLIIAARCDTHRFSEYPEDNDNNSGKYFWIKVRIRLNIKVNSKYEVSKKLLCKNQSSKCQLI